MAIDKKCHSIAMWMADGTIEIGGDGYRNSTTARVLDEGGICWETTEDFANLEEALNAIEAGIAAVCEERGIVWRDA